ncbi:MAG: 50S ribosomal protein L11 methyltransferase [Alphaproteobacteria bacterium]|nr:50S ribosomal protein L11 methyltransferase [Alphaproteobacteria bacterium]
MALARIRDLDLSLIDNRVLLRAPGRGIGAKVPTLAVAVLSFCDQPRTREQVVQAFGPPGGQLYDGLAELGVLVDPDAALDTPVFFQNFASLDTHRRMLADRLRLDAYRDGLNEVVTPDSVVVDAGTGSGVLAMLAARAGAKRVYGIDNAEVLEHARAVVEANGLAETIALHAGDFRTAKLPEPAQVLVTETFGALAYAEGATPDLQACLANNGADAVVVPSHVELWVAPVGPATRQAAFAGFATYGDLSFAPLEEASRHRGIMTEVPADALLAEPVRLSRREWPRDSDAFTATARFDIEGAIGGLCAWFDLQMSPGVRLSTGPRAPLTHWKHTFLPLDPLEVRGALELVLRFGPPANDRRGYEVEGEIRTAQGVVPVSWRVR